MYSSSITEEAHSYRRRALGKMPLPAGLLVRQLLLRAYFITHHTCCPTHPLSQQTATCRPGNPTGLRDAERHTKMAVRNQQLARLLRGARHTFTGAFTGRLSALQHGCQGTLTVCAAHRLIARPQAAKPQGGSVAPLCSSPHQSSPRGTASAQLPFRAAVWWSVPTAFPQHQAASCKPRVSAAATKRRAPRAVRDNRPRTAA